MSTKTTFKRIALVAVAALGLGVLSVAPVSATPTGLTVAVTNGTAPLGGSGDPDSSTAGTVNVTALFDSTSDSATVQLILKSKPSAGGDIGRLFYKETSTPLGNGTLVESYTVSVVEGHAIAANWGVKAVTNAKLEATSSLSTNSTTGKGYRISTGAVGYVGGKFLFQVDTGTASSRAAGTYVYTIVAKSYGADQNGVSVLQQTVSADVSIVISDTAANIALVGGTIDAGRSTAWINTGSTYTTASDSAVAVVSTAAATDHAIIRVSTFTSDGNPSPESVTATVTGAGVVCVSSGTICGKSIKMLGTGGVTDFTVRADGTAGTGSIVIATTTKTFPAKTVTFYAKAAKTLTASVNKAVIGTAGDTDVIRVSAVDADGNNWGGTAYIYASTAADALIAGSTTPVACTYSSALSANLCPVTGLANGTAKFKVIDAATVAAATATSNEVSVRVSTASPASVKLSFDKSTYAPGERATIWATVLDSSGNALPGTSITNLWASGGVVSSLALTKLSTNDLSSLDGTTQGATSTTDPNNPTYAGAVSYVYTMPYTTGTVTLTAKGGTGLAAAGRVTVTASAEVVNASADAATDAANEATDAANAATDAALAAADAADAATAAAQDASDAVAALSASVSKLISSLRAQITSLTNLVIKIQKKVKA